VGLGGASRMGWGEGTWSKVTGQLSGLSQTICVPSEKRTRVVYNLCAVFAEIYSHYYFEFQHDKKLDLNNG
jgi:hypothetical protein